MYLHKSGDDHSCSSCRRCDVGTEIRRLSVFLSVCSGLNSRVQGIFNLHLKRLTGGNVGEINRGTDDNWNANELDGGSQ